MDKYRKLPVVIEAIQWSGKTGIDKNNLDEIKAFVGEENMHTELNDIAWQAGVSPPSLMLYIHTLEGQMLAMPKDYIIKGVNGEFYPCKPDIFEKTYEFVEPCEECLYSFYWNCGRQGDVQGLFKAKPIEIQNLIGRTVYFGEILGKHSEIYGEIEADEIKLESDEPDVVRNSIESGYNPLEYIRCSECDNVLDLTNIVSDENICNDCYGESGEDGD